MGVTAVISMEKADKLGVLQGRVRRQRDRKCHEEEPGNRKPAVQPSRSHVATNTRSATAIPPARVGFLTGAPRACRLARVA